MPSGSQDINVKVLALIGAVSVILFVALVISAQAWFSREFAMQKQREFVDVPFAELQTIKQKQYGDLNAPAHEVTEKAEDGSMVTLKVIPIDEAMRMVVQKYGPGGAQAH